MNIKERIKSYSFWISLASAVFLVIKVIGQKFGFTVDETLFNDIITSMCSILVILGIIVPPGSSKNKMISAEISSEVTSISNKISNILTPEKLERSQSFEEIVAETHEAEPKVEEINKITSSEITTEQNEIDNIEVDQLNPPAETNYIQETTVLFEEKPSPKETFLQLLEAEKSKFQNINDYFEVLSTELHQTNNNTTTE